jgi:hypothetical protein
MKKPTHLLSAEEIAYIEKHGLKNGKPTDLLHVGAEDTVVFTVKGIAAFQYAIGYFGYPGKLSDVRTLEDYEDFYLAMKSLVIRTLKNKLAALQAKSPNPSETQAVVEAVLYGTPQQVLETLTQSLALKVAGKNITLLPVKKYGQP